MKNKKTFKAICMMMVLSATISIAFDAATILYHGSLVDPEGVIMKYRMYLITIIYTCSILNTVLQFFAGYYGNKYGKNQNRANTIVMLGIASVITNLISVIAGAMSNVSIINLMVHALLVLVPTTYLVSAIQLTKYKEAKLELA